METGLTIDWETADRITLLNLKDHLATLEKEVHDHVTENKWMHPEDFKQSTIEYIPALKTMIKFYGG